MGYYCTVPQCTSLAGKTKNVKFHRFPRDVTMADKWNIILKRGKPYTKYSKVCSLHFTQGDYNVTTMGQWKTLSKDAVPSQNLPKLNPDGSVMVIRKSRTVKYREGGRKEECDKADKWQMPMAHPLPLATPDVPCGSMDTHHDNVLYRLQTLGHMANNVPQQHPIPHGVQKPKKQDAIMQTDPVQNEDDDTQPNNSYSEVSEKSYSSELDQYGYPKDYNKDDYPMKDDSYPKDTTYKESYPKDGAYQKDGYPKDYQPKDGSSKDYPKDDAYPKEGNYPKDGNYQKDGYQEKDGQKRYEPKDYTKSQEDYIPQTNEEYNKEAEKYALERKSHNGYEPKDYQKTDLYPKIDYTYGKYRDGYQYQNGYTDSAELLRNQQHNLLLQERENRINESQSYFNENHIKQEIDITDEDKFMYERTKEQLDANQYERRIQQQRFLDIIKQEPDVTSGVDPLLLPPGSTYYPPNGHSNPAGYYDPLSRPGPELLRAKQNALAAHQQLWQNTMKRPFFYSEAQHYNGPQLLHRYDDISRILQ